jgi:hypothetical protein
MPNCCGVRRVIFPIVIIISLTIFLSLYFGGYSITYKQNMSLLNTTCLISSYKVNSGGRPGGTYDCFCEPECPTPTTCGQHCSQCWYHYYNGYINVLVNNTITIEILIIGNNYNIYDENVVMQKLTVDYPINSTIDCYYPPDNINNIKLGLYPTLGYLISGFVFLGIACVLLITWAILEFILLYKRRHYGTMYETLK